MPESKCKICRRVGVKLFLRGEKCFSPKCPMVKKAYPPGKKGKRRPIPLSEYGKELREKQKLKNWYNLNERQFKNYVKEVFKKRRRVEDTRTLLIQKLESRLDNTIYRLGLAPSHGAARQMVSHGHLLVNGKPINVPSYSLKPGDKISIRPSSKKKTSFQNLILALKKYQPPPWLELDKTNIEGKLLRHPTLEEVAPPVEISAIFELYSR